MTTQTYTIWKECKMTPQAIRRGIFFASLQARYADFRDSSRCEIIQKLFKKGCNPEFVTGFAYAR